MIGNERDLPPGTSRLLVTLYGPQVVTVLEADGSPVGANRLPEAGWTAYTVIAELTAGESVRYHVEYSLPPGSGDDPTHRAVDPAPAPSTVVTPSVIDRNCR